MAEKAAETKEKLVKIRIPHDRRDDSPAYVSVNERTWLIQRGVEVEVPECVEEVLRHRDETLDTIYKFDQEHNKG